MKETLTFNGREPVNVEIRVAKRTLSADPGAVRVKGRAVDALTGVPSAAARIALCCRDSGFNERFSAPLNADGSFEFSAIPPGHYAVGLEVSAGSPNAFIVGRDIDVGSQGLAELKLFSTPQFGELVARLVLEGGCFLPENATGGVAFKSTTGRVEVISRQSRDGIYSAALPVGDRYIVSVIDLPDGYVVKSISGSTEVRPANNPPIGVPPLPAPIVITLAPAPR